MRNWVNTALSIALVLGIGMVARRVALSAWDSVVRYQPPYHSPARLPAGPRLVQRVILVTIDGLRLDTSRRLPFLNELRRRGAGGVVLAGEPSLSNPGRAALATGAWADIHGITSNFAVRRVGVDSVFSLAHTAGLKTATAGSRFWYRTFQPWVDEFLRSSGEPQPASPAELQAWQHDECDRKLKFLRSAQFDFAVVDYVAGDIASHDFGARSAAAEDVHRITDECVRDLAASQNLCQTTLIVLADHGHIDRGGHGGNEPEVVAAPLVLAGGPVRAGAKIEARQIDIAPTICALLGLPLPSTSQGRVLLDALQLDTADRKALEAQQDQQQQGFARYQRGLLGGNQAQAARAARFRRLPACLGLGAILVLLLTWLVRFVLRTPGERVLAVGGVAAFYAAYYLLFKLQGLGYSLSTVNKEEYLESFFLADMLVAAAALLLTTFLIGVLSGQGSARLAAAVTLLVSLSLAAQVLGVHWYHGLWMGRWLPNFNWLFKTYLDLLALFGLCFALWGTLLAHWMGAWLRRAGRTTAPA